MSYKCFVCEKAQEPGTPMKRHILYKDDRNIKEEKPVCEDCKSGLKAGYTVQALRRIVGNDPKQVPAALDHLPKEVFVNTPDAQPVSFRRKRS